MPVQYWNFGACQCSIGILGAYFGCGQCAARIGQGCTCWIWFPTSDSVPFFQNRLGSYCTKPARDPTWMAGSGFGQMHLVRTVRKHAGMRGNHWVPVLAEHIKPATSFPLSDSVAFFHRSPRAQLWAKPTWVQFGSGWLSGLGQIDPVWKQASLQESSGPFLATASELILIGCESDPACLLGYIALVWFLVFMHGSIAGVMVVGWCGKQGKAVREWATCMVDLAMDWKCLPLSVAVSAYHCSDVQHPLWAVESQAVSLDGHHSGVPLASHWSRGGAPLVGLLPLRHNRPCILRDLRGESLRGYLRRWCSGHFSHMAGEDCSSLVSNGSA